MMPNPDIVSYRTQSPDNGCHHWCGYYDVTPWSGDARHFCCLESDFMDHAPGPFDRARILVLDAAGRNPAAKVGETAAWNWQMGCRLQWAPEAPDRDLWFNDRRGGRFVAVRHNLASGVETVLPYPFYAISRNGRQAVTLNFSRLHDCRPGYGYCGLKDFGADQNAPGEDGLFRLDLQSGSRTLLAAYAEIVAVDPTPAMKGRKHWINHLFWGPDDRRILFLHRWRDEAGRCTTRMLAMDPDGRNLTLLGTSPTVSHFDWQHPDSILVYAALDGQPADYCMVRDPDGAVRRLCPGQFDSDGHCSWSPDRQWMLTDVYPSGPERRYGPVLYHPEANRRIPLFEIAHPRQLPADCRCDLHPRWRRDGRQISVDAVLDGRRRVLVADVCSVLE